MEDNPKQKINKSLITKIIITVVFCALVILSIIIYNNYRKNEIESKTIGEITVIIIDIEGNTIANDVLSFKEKDTLWELIVANYGGEDLIYNTRETYGVQLLGIKGIKTDFLYGSYLALWVDEKYSSLGISSIPLKDKMVLKIIETKV